MLFRALQTSVRTRIRRSVPVKPPFSGAGVRSGYLEPPLPGAGSSVWVCRASLTRGRFIIPALCGRPFPSDCGVEGEAGGIASRTGRRLRSVLPHIPGGVLRGGYEKSVRKSWPREVVGMERGGKGGGCGMKAQNSAAARLAERGVAGRMPFSRITIGCFETLTRHPAATAFGGTSHPVSLRDIRSGGNPRLCNKTHKPRPHSLPLASLPFCRKGMVPAFFGRTRAIPQAGCRLTPRPSPASATASASRSERYSAAAARPRLATRGNKGPLRSVPRSGRRCRMKTCR